MLLWTWTSCINLEEAVGLRICNFCMFFFFLIRSYVSFFLSLHTLRLLCISIAKQQQQASQQYSYSWFWMKRGKERKKKIMKEIWKRNAKEKFLVLSQLSHHEKKNIQLFSVHLYVHFVTIHQVICLMHIYYAVSLEIIAIKIII